MSDKTIYDPETDTLACGCNPDWPDHRCRYGCSVCGAPDDCYCPSLGEILDDTTNDFDFTGAWRLTIGDANFYYTGKYPGYSALYDAIDDTSLPVSIRNIDLTLTIRQGN